MTAIAEKTRSKGARAFRFLLSVFWIGFAASILLVAAWTWYSGLDAMVRGLAAAKPWLAAWRLLFFAVLICGWRYWIGCLTRWIGLDEPRYRHALNQRWRAAAWLLVIETLLIQGVAAKFFSDFMGLR